MSNKPRLHNPMDDPQMYREGKCSICSKCRIHILSGKCIYGGPFKGYEPESKKEERNA